MGVVDSVVDASKYSQYPDNPPPYFIADRVYPPVRIPDHFLDCVCFVGTYVNGIFSPEGTGFFIAIEEEGLRFQHVVTARHVIERIANAEIFLRVNLVGGGCEIIRSRKANWIRADEKNKRTKLDIAALPTHIEAEKYQVLNINIEGEDDVASEKVVAANDIGIGDDVFYMGLHTSHFGAERNVPVVRMGTIAAVSDEPFETEIGFVEGYLIEARSIGGTSGSPVFVSIPPLKVISGEVVQMQSKPAYFWHDLRHLVYL